MFEMILRNFSETALSKLKLDDAARDRFRRKLSEVRMHRVPESGEPARPETPLKRGMFAGMGLLAALATVSHADYSPFREGRVWVYQGKGTTVNPLLKQAYAEMVRVDFKETLTLKVTDMEVSGRFTFITVEERDSLYARKAGPKGQPTSIPWLPLPDTVIIRTLTYVEQESLLLRKGDSLSLGHRDSADLFFPTVRAAPKGNSNSNSALTGLDAPYQGVETTEYYRWPATHLEVHYSAWYVDGVGLFWASVRTSLGTCDFPESRELKLVSLDGKPLDIGRDPPGTPLAKDARIACGLVKPDFRGGATFVRKNGAAASNALGRRLMR